METNQAAPTRQIAAAVAVAVLLGACQGQPPTVQSIDASDTPAAEPFAIPTAHGRVFDYSTCHLNRRRTDPTPARTFAPQRLGTGGHLLLNSPAAMGQTAATAIAHPNIALIKYWGNRDHDLRIPSNGSISLTLAGMQTKTSVVFDEELESDRVTIDGQEVRSPRVTALLDLIRQLGSTPARAQVDSVSDFPSGAGLAASAAAFAALSLAASQAAGLRLEPVQLSRLARRGSGSAARSVFGGYVELLAGENDEQCFARPIADPHHWGLVDLVAVVNRVTKSVDSTAGHARADSSPIQLARVADAPRRLEACRQAVLQRDFERLAAVAEQDSDLMHAVMMTSVPGIHYWLPETLAVMSAVRRLRSGGTQVFYTVDAGPNVHCLCQPAAESAVRARLEQLPGSLEIYRGTSGGGARLL